MLRVLAEESVNGGEEMREPIDCVGCLHSKVYRHSGWECTCKEECSNSECHESKADLKLTPEERKGGQNE